MGFLAISSHTDDCTRETTIGFLAICSCTNCTKVSTIGLLAISSHRDWTREATMGFLDNCIIQT